MSNSVAEVFKSLDHESLDNYTSYWGMIGAGSHAEYFKRWLFAFCSVHTTWESNVRGYKAISNYEEWLQQSTSRELLRRLIAARCGLHNNRATWIWNFSQDFWYDPSAFYRKDFESWTGLRDRLQHRITGLGPAKTSFAIEMAFPLEAKLCCLDIHMLRLYDRPDLNKGKSPAAYAALEADWVGRSGTLGVAPYIARMVYWDKQQGCSNSRYWSHVLEA